MSGVFSPEVWANGDDTDNIPTADDLNLEWANALTFLMHRPIAYLYNTTGTAITTTEVNVPFNNEKLVQQGMTHSTVTNNHQLSLPYTGQYSGFALGGFQTISTLSTRLIIRVKKNGTTVAAASMKPENTSGWNIHCSLSIDAAATDIITMTMVTTSGTAVMGNLIAASKLMLYYSGEYV
jgi:hypothetical protein